MKYKNESFITDLADGYSDEIFNETKEAYAKAKAFDEIVPFVREQYVRANQNYGFAKYYGKSNEELKQAEEELFEKQQVAITVCNALDITLGEFIMMEGK
ncbi:hypothetical protein [Mammaliicoccus sciuri]|uniref:hypothetical protein n=1 Tax=Mammaliicoccus sciuri TaxID=1296 RepID=UPI002DBA6800|nr:hypothetical protein [Mammaliicoccus sciuri]MEB6232518.1 hypothetical protein [Mammaliicoccus sciuri]